MKANTIYDAMKHAATSPIYGIHVGKMTSDVKRSRNVVAPKHSKCLEVDFDDCQTIKVPLKFVDADTNVTVDEISAKEAIEALLHGTDTEHYTVSHVDTSVMLI